MNTREAKDFLIQQAAEQAALEHVPLSDLEKRIMYFTESDASSCNDPIELNEEFEAQYDTQEYEDKVSTLLQHARQRLQAENSGNLRNWDEAIRILSRGDHYVLILCNATSAGLTSTADFLKPVGIGLLIALGIAAVMILTDGYNLDGAGYSKYLPILFIGLFVLFYKALSTWLGRRTKDGDSH